MTSLSEIDRTDVSTEKQNPALTPQGFRAELIHGYERAKTALQNPIVEAGLVTAGILCADLAFHGRGEGLLSKLLPEVSITGEKAITAATNVSKVASGAAPKIIYFDRDLLDPSLPEQSTILRDVFRADQSDAQRSKSFEGYAKLLDSRPKFVGTDLEPQFQHALSFESFHMGQFEALQAKSNVTALAYFEKSAEHSEDAFRSWVARGNLSQGEGQAEWTNYVRGNIAYMKADVAQVGAHEEMERDGFNKQKLVNFKQGLQDFGTPDYQRDYLSDNIERL
jgi:hypothetical protein